MPPVAAAVSATATFLAGTAFTVGTVAVSWGTLLLTTTSLASSLVAVSSKPSGAVAEPGRNIGIGVDAFMPRKCAYGRTATSGDRIFADTYSSNQKLGQVLALSIGMISGVTSTVLNETTVTIDGSDVVQTAPWADKMRFKFKDGADDKTAHSTLVSGSPHWTSAHRGRGVSDVFWEIDYDQDALAGGIPVPMFIGDYAIVYDPRKDSTNGGSGSHRADDPTTWEFSRSGPLLALHYILGIYQNGKRVWGLGVPTDLIDFGSFAAAADLCEADVDGKPRFTTGGVVSADDNPREVLEAFGASFGGAIFPSGGLIKCIAAGPITASLTLTDDDLAGGVEYIGNQSFRDAVNTVRVKFTDPDRDYRANTTASITDSSYITEDNDEILDEEFPALMSDDEECAHRLGRLRLANKREPRTIRARWKAKAFRLVEGSTVNIASARLGVTEKMIVLERSLQPSGTVQLTLRTETDAKYSAMDAFTQAMPAFARVDRYDPTAVATPDGEDWTTTAVELDSGTAKLPVIRVTGGTDDPLVRGALIEYRVAGDSDWQRWAEVTSVSAVRVDIAGLTPGTEYETRISYRNVSGVLGDPLEPDSVTTTGSLVATDAVSVEDARERINDRLESAHETLADAMQAVTDLGATGAQLSTLNWLADPLFRTGTAGFDAVQGQIMPVAGSVRSIEAVWLFGSSGEQTTKVLTWPARKPVQRYTPVQAAFDLTILGAISSVELQAVWYDSDGDELSSTAIASGTTGRIGSVVYAPEDAAEVSIRCVVTTSASGYGSMQLSRPMAAYALAGQSDSEGFQDPDNETTARIASLERTVAGMAEFIRSLQVETRRGRAGFRQNVTAISNEEQSRISAVTSLSTSLATLEGNVYTQAQADALFFTSSETNAAIAGFDLSLNTSFTDATDRLDTLEGAGYLTEATADLLFMTSAEVNSAVAAFDLSLNSTFEAATDRLDTLEGAGYLTEASADLLFMTSTEVNSAISTFDLSLNTSFTTLSDRVGTLEGAGYITAASANLTFLAIADAEGAFAEFDLSLNSQFSDLSDSLDTLEGNVYTQAQADALFFTSAEVDSAIAGFDLSLNTTFTDATDRLDTIEGAGYLTEASADLLFMTSAEVDSAMAAFDLSLNSTFTAATDRLDTIEGAGYLTEASADLLFMTSAEVNSAVASFDLSLNATFEALSDDLSANYYTKSEADLEFTTLAEVTSAITTFDLSLNSDFNGLSSSVTLQGTAISGIEDNLLAAYAWTLDAGGKIAGMQALNDGATASINFAFDALVIEGAQRFTFDTESGVFGAPSIVVDTLEAGSVKVNSVETGHLGTRSAAFVDSHDFCTSTAGTTDSTTHFDTLTVDTEAIPVKPGSQLTAKVGYEMSGRYNSYEYLFFRSKIQLRVTRSDDTVVTVTPTTWEESNHIHKTTSNVGGGPSVGNDYQVENQYGKEVVYVLPTTGSPWVYGGEPFKKIALRLIIEPYSPQTSGSKCVFGSINSTKIKTYQELQDVHAILECAIDGPFVNVVKQTVSGSTTTSGGTDGAGAIPIIDWDAGDFVMP